MSNVFHRDLTQEHLHLPKYHASTHEVGGTDPLASATNWNIAFSWGNHSGLYDTIGTSTASMLAHNTLYDHTLFITSETDPLSLHLANETDNVTGGTFNLTTTGTISAASGVFDIVLLADDPTSDLEAATKQYVDAISGINGYIVFQPQSGKVGHLTAPAQIDGSQKRWYVLFDKDTDESIDFQFVMPYTYTTQTLTCTLIWTPKVASGNVVWNVSLMATIGTAASDLETDSFDTVNAATSAAQSTIGYPSSVDIVMVNKDSVTAGDICTIRITRDADSEEDTNNGDAQLAGITLEWS